MRKNAPPINRIDCANLVFGFEFQIVTDGFDNILAVIKDTIYGEIKNIRVLQGIHLRRLKGTHLPFRRKHKYADPCFTTHGVFSGTTGITRGGAQDIEMLTRALQCIFKQVTQQLHSHVFEC